MPNTLEPMDTVDIHCERYARDTWKLNGVTRKLHAISPLLSTVFIQTTTWVLLLYFKAVLRTSAFFVRRAGSSASGSLILPPSFPGSLGDETMMRVAVDQLKKKGRVSYLHTADEHEWDFLDPELHSVGASLLFPWNRAFNPLFLHKTVRAMHAHAAFFCIGADVMDGNYSELGSRLRIELLRLAAGLGKDVTLLGFSFNNHPVCSVVRDLGTLPSSVHLCARDPISLRRLQSCIKQPVDLVADTAFLLENQQPEDATLTRWIETERQAGRLVVGINPSVHNAMSKEGGAGHIVTMYVQTLIECSSAESMSFVLIPHDVRKIDVNSDRTMATLIQGQLPPELRAHVTIAPETLTQPQLQYLCGLLDFAVTGRMHLAIKCLNTGVPLFCIGYQDKFEGLLQLFGLKDCVIPAEDVLRYASLTQFVLPAVQRREDTKKTILAALPNVRTLAAKNFGR